MAAAIATDHCISLVRPKTSESGPATSSAMPSPRVASETVKALSPGDTWNSSASSGSRA